MAYEPLRRADLVRNEAHAELGEASETDVETAKRNSCSSPADEAQSFLGWSRRGVETHENSNPARLLSKRGTSQYFTVFRALLPWGICFLLAIQVVVLAWKLEMQSRSTTSSPPKSLMYTLAEEAIEYRIETTYASEDFPDSDYQGWPNAEKDRLWNKYEDGNFLWIDAQAAAQLPFATEHAPAAGHEEDYVVGLSVFHVLHCLSVLRRSLYPRRYNSSLVGADGAVDWRRWHHVDHCLETVRRDVTCHADTAATTWEWVEATQMTIRPETRHVCRDFDRLSEWAYARHVAASQRAHVEGGRVVDYTGRPPSEAWSRIEVRPPADWNYREEDL